MSSEEINKKIEELQMIESHLQGFLAQKQILQIELNEIENALEEVKSSDKEVYKMVVGFMIKSNKEELKKELEEKKKLLDMRISSMEKQEILLERNAANLKKEIDDSIAKSKK